MPMTYNESVAAEVRAEMARQRLSQTDLATMNADILPILDGLSKLGCRFSMDQVRNLNVNFSQLNARHIRFVKMDAMRAALDGMDVAYYLIHSLGSTGEFERRDREAATIFARAARAAGARRVIYLGGLMPAADRDLSPHLRSRGEVGDILLAGGVPAAVLQAAVIIGSGSVSFEMLRYLTERLPVMTTPRWVRTRIQPIAVRDVLRYLVGCASLPADVSRRFDVGGPDILTYADMMNRYARVAGLRPRIILPVPLLSPGLSSLWVGLVTPVPPGLARPLVESLRNEVVCAEHDIASHVPDPQDGLVGIDRAIALALRQTRTAEVATRWSSAATLGAPSELLPSDPQPSDPSWAGGSLYLDDRVRRVHASGEELWRTIQGIGGDRGWYSFPLAWSVRGLLDRAMGGVGLRRGRRDPDRLEVGDALDFWRVEEIVPGTLLRLRAEMKLPGRAWLGFSVRPGKSGASARVEPGRSSAASALQIDEAALTGESVPAPKDARTLPGGDLGPADQTNMAFMNTPVTHGSGVMLVTATGTGTELGQISGMLSATTAEKSPLTRQLNNLTLWIAGAAGLTMVVMFVLGRTRGQAWDALFTSAVALAIAALPEALPTVS